MRLAFNLPVCSSAFSERVFALTLLGRRTGTVWPPGMRFLYETIAPTSGTVGLGVGFSPPIYWFGDRFLYSRLFQRWEGVWLLTRHSYAHFSACLGQITLWLSAWEVRASRTWLAVGLCCPAVHRVSTAGNAFYC